jgi:hypothetical protein
MLEQRYGRPYVAPMDDTPRHDAAGEWAEILAESEAEVEAGLFVSGDEIIRELHESIVRMEKRSANAVTGSNPRR